MTSQLVLEAISAIKAGEKNRARKLLAEAIKQNGQDDDAWYVLAAVAPGDEQRIECLERAVEINPQNQKAFRLLEKLKPPDVDDITETRNAGLERDKKVKPPPNKQKIWIVIAGIITIFVVMCCLIFIALGDNKSTIKPSPAVISTEPSETTVTLTNIPQRQDTGISIPEPTKAFIPPGGFIAPGVWNCPSSTEGAAYLGSTESDKFHTPGCSHAKKIKPENRICFLTRQAAINYKYIPCGTCKP